MNRSIRNLTLTAMLMAVGVVLPFFTGQIPRIGNMLLPMHIPIFLCGLLCGWKYGAAAGFILPLFRSVLFGMPVLFPTAAAMAFELMTYGLVAGWLYERSRRQSVIALYRSLLPAMLAGRIVWGMVQMLFLGLGQRAFTWEIFMAGAFLNAVPGIALQLVLIPLVMVALNRTGIVPFQRPQTAHLRRKGIRDDD